MEEPIIIEINKEPHPLVIKYRKIHEQDKKPKRNYYENLRYRAGCIVSSLNALRRRKKRLLSLGEPTTDVTKYINEAAKELEEVREELERVKNGSKFKNC